ncbi:hypothetical protein BJ944DRAFT_268787 [Cunninghamella echinulata]|nr:hypothetical protein BJ944DRAFT_268787 [Cunninghamella echinulata]
MNQRHGLAIATLEEIIKTIKESKELTSNHIRVLHNLLNSTLLDALNLIDTQSVIKVNCGTKNKRSIFVVIEKNTVKHDDIVGGDDDTNKRGYYLCYLTPRHCPCKSFLHSVICDQSTLICKHILACILYDALDYTTPSINMDEERFAELLFLQTLPS